MLNMFPTTVGMFEIKNPGFITSIKLGEE